MNPYYIAVLGAIFVLFISMGNNPFEVPEGYVAPDPFKEGIKERITTRQDFATPSTFGTSGFGNTFGNGSAINTPGRIPGAAHYGVGDRNLQSSERNLNGSNNVYNSVIKPGYRPTGPNINGNGNFQQKPNNNVPTPFKNLPNINGGGAYYFQDAPNIRTSNGKPVKFQGATVYTISSKGRVITMPDGKYFLGDGREIQVRGGKSIMHHDANKFWRGS